MRYTELSQKISSSIFTSADLAKYFADEPENQINTQMHRFLKNGTIISLKRGIYTFANKDTDEFVVASKLYSPSYISLETALNIYGIIPDIPMNVTSVTTTTSKKIKTQKGVYLYSKINKNLFFGYENTLDKASGLYYPIALPEKALLDYIYIRKIKDLEENRVDTSDLNQKILNDFAKQYPVWVSKVLKNE